MLTIKKRSIRDLPAHLHAPKEFQQNLVIYKQMRWRAKELAQSCLDDLPPAQRILLIFPESREMLTATYACLDKGHTGIAYHYTSAQKSKLLKDLKKHQIQKIWCAADLKQELEQMLATTDFARLLI